MGHLYGCVYGWVRGGRLVCVLSFERVDCEGLGKR